MLFSLCDYLHEHADRIRSRADIESSELEVIIGPQTAPPQSPLNHLFEYFKWLNALDPTRSKALTQRLQGRYRLYRYGLERQILCSTLEIFKYRSTQKTPYFENFLLDEKNNLRRGRGNILELGSDLIFWALLEQSRKMDDPNDFKELRAESHGGNAYLRKPASWDGLKVMVFSKPSVGTLDQHVGLYFSRSADGAGYEYGRVLAIQEDEKHRPFSHPVPSQGDEEEILNDLRQIMPSITFDDLALQVDGHTFRHSILHALK